MKNHKIIIAAFIAIILMGCKFPFFAPSKRPINDSDYALYNRKNICLDSSDWKVNGIFLRRVWAEDSSYNYYSYYKLLPNCRVLDNKNGGRFPTLSILNDSSIVETGFYTIRKNGKIKIEGYHTLRQWGYLFGYFEDRTLVIERARYRSFIFSITKERDAKYDFITLSDLEK